MNLSQPMLFASPFIVLSESESLQRYFTTDTPNSSSHIKTRLRVIISPRRWTCWSFARWPDVAKQNKVNTRFKSVEQTHFSLLFTSASLAIFAYRRRTMHEVHEVTLKSFRDSSSVHIVTASFGERLFEYDEVWEKFFKLKFKKTYINYGIVVKLIKLAAYNSLVIRRRKLFHCGSYNYFLFFFFSQIELHQSCTTFWSSY